MGEAATASRGRANHRWIAPRVQSPEYSVWRRMRERCNNPNHLRYARYGGRGISTSDLGQELLNLVGPA